MSNNSYNGHLVFFKNYFKHLIDVQIIKSNPFIGLKSFAKQSTPYLYFQRVQTDILKNAISERDPQLWLFVQLIYYYFIRPGEIRNLKIEDIIFESGQILIPASISKNKKANMY